MMTSCGISKFGVASRLARAELSMGGKDQYQRQRRGVDLHLSGNSVSIGWQCRQPALACYEPHTQ